MPTLDKRPLRQKATRTKIFWTQGHYKLHQSKLQNFDDGGIVEILQLTLMKFKMTSHSKNWKSSSNTDTFAAEMQSN